MKTREILQYPYAVKDFGTKKYYVWPSFAARSPEELQLARLSFMERADLIDLVGQEGIRRIEAGESYPGFRLAITQDGKWAYLLQDN